MKMIFARLGRPGVVLALALLIYACSDGGSNAPTVQPAGGALSSPARLADIDADSFLVSDYNSGLIQQLDKQSLLPVSSFKIGGRATGVALAKGLYFVGNRATLSVDVYDGQGAFLYHLGGATGVFQSVNDLAVDADAEIVFVLDTKAAQVRLFWFDGTDTGMTVGAGILLRPTALTLDDAASTLLVSDFGDPLTSVPPSVQIFDPYDATIPSPVLDQVVGGSARFSTPQGIWVDAGHLFLADTISGEAQVYRLSDGVLVKTLGQIGTADGELLYPLDVLVDPTSKDVFVADNRNGRITVFRAGGVIP